MNVVKIFSILGILISLYLIYAYEISKNIVCIGSGCEIVANSVYSKFLNIPLPFFGLLFYLTMLFLSIIRFESILLFFGLVGAVFSLYLTFIEVFVLRAICMWCLISAICSWIIAINLAFVNVKK